MNDVDRVDEHTAAVHRRDAGRIVRLAFVLVIIAALVIVAMDNRDDVRIGYAFGDANAPVWIALVLSSIAGVVVGWLVRLRRRHD